MNRLSSLAYLAILFASLVAAVSAQAEAIFPVASRIGLVPPPGLKPSQTFVGFEDTENSVFIRIIAMPGPAYAELEKSMTGEALRKQGLTVEKRESRVLPSGKGVMILARQEQNSVRFQKWLLVAPVGDITALVSVEIPQAAKARYPEAEIRKSLTSLTIRNSVPVEEQLALVPFRLSDVGGLRLARVVPGVAVQLTDGPNDSFENVEQAHLVVSVAAGGPRQASDRDSFARLAFSGLPPLKDIRLVSSEPMRIGGSNGHEIRAEAKDPKSGADVEIVQWLRFGTNGYIRIIAFAPRQNWPQTLARFRAVRDGIETR